MQPEVFNGGLVIYDDGNLTQDPQGCPIVILGVEGDMHHHCSIVLRFCSCLDVFYFVNRKSCFLVKWLFAPCTPVWWVLCFCSWSSLFCVCSSFVNKCTWVFTTHLL